MAKNIGKVFVKYNGQVYEVDDITVCHEVGSADGPHVQLPVPESITVPLTVSREEEFNWMVFTLGREAALRMLEAEIGSGVWERQKDEMLNAGAVFLCQMALYELARKKK